MKKLTSLLLAAAMVMALAACGNSGGDKSGTGAPPPSGGSSQGGGSGTLEPAGPEPITLNLAYMPNYASLWGVLSADSQGFFAEEGAARSTWPTSARAPTVCACWATPSSLPPARSIPPIRS